MRSNPTFLVDFLFQVSFFVLVARSLMSVTENQPVCYAFVPYPRCFLRPQMTNCHCRGSKQWALHAACECRRRNPFQSLFSLADRQSSTARFVRESGVARSRKQHLVTVTMVAANALEPKLRTSSRYQPSQRTEKRTKERNDRFSDS